MQHERVTKTTKTTTTTDDLILVEDDLVRLLRNDGIDVPDDARVWFGTDDDDFALCPEYPLRVSWVKTETEEVE